MDLDQIVVDKTEARAKYLEYQRAVRAGGNADDAQIMRGYREVAKGRTVISMTAAIRKGGRHVDGLPKLAVARADAERCYLESCRLDGAVRFVTKRGQWSAARGEEWRSSRNRLDVRDFPAGTLAHLTKVELPERAQPRYPNGDLIDRVDRYAIVPPVPPGLRPGFNLKNYDILWEVDRWAVDPEPPADPALLKHIGGDLYAVMAVWDLTELERLVIRGR